MVFLRFFSLYRWFNSFPAVRFLLAVKMFHVEQRLRLPGFGFEFEFGFGGSLRSFGHGFAPSSFGHGFRPACKTLLLFSSTLRLRFFRWLRFYPQLRFFPVVCFANGGCLLLRPPGSIFFAHFLLLFSSFVSASLSTAYKIAPVFWFFFSSPHGWFSCITPSVATLYIGFPVLLPGRFYFFGG